MVPKFKPEITLLPIIEFRPFMVETAYDYLKTVTTSKHERGFIRETLGALAIEIILKSYMAKANGNFQQLDERYEIKRIRNSDFHNLKCLAENLPPIIKSYLLDKEDEKVIGLHQDTFKNSRYCYEKNAPNFYSDAPICLAAKLICKTIYVYQEQGCNDPFITSFDVNKLYFSIVQNFY
jgi:hypothetical protein